jgi:hypothetical protein
MPAIYSAHLIHLDLNIPFVLAGEYSYTAAGLSLPTATARYVLSKFSSYHSYEPDSKQNDKTAHGNILMGLSPAASH